MLKLLIALCFVFPLSATAGEVSLREQFSEGGVALVFILLMSVLLVAVSAERLFNFRTKSIYSDDLITRVNPMWRAGDFQKIHELLAVENNTLGRIIHYLVCHRHQQSSELALGASEIASFELRQHQQKAYALGIVATVAPIVGLLGTVIGMIEAFHVIAYSQGMGNPALLAGGISKALINTAAGLSVALPALAMHHTLRHRSLAFSLQLEQGINQCIASWFKTAGVDAVTNSNVVCHEN